MYNKKLSIKPSKIYVKPSDDDSSLRTVESSNRSSSSDRFFPNINPNLHIANNEDGVDNGDGDEEMEPKFKNFFSLEEKLEEKLYTIIAYFYYNNKKNKTENEEILYDTIKHEALSIINTLNHKEKQILNNINDVDIIKLHKYSCNKIINENIKIIDNKKCNNDDDINKMYINSEITDNLLKCPTNDFFENNLDDYLNLETCK